MTRLPISICIIAGNEARRIRSALESVAGWTGEIIVVLNDDVNDGTDRIAAEFGAKVFREPWKGHIAQKNSAVQKATQEWVLGLDSDESVSLELRDEIQGLFSDSLKKHDYAGFSFPRCTLYCGRWIRHGDWYPDRQTRLWRRGTAEWGGIDPHDKLVVKGNVGRLKGDLLHDTMESLEQQIKKTMSYAEDFSRHCAEKGKRVHLSDIVFRPGWRFFRAYFLRFGFMDGWQGFVIARMASVYTFLRYLKAYQTQNDAMPPTEAK